MRRRCPRSPSCTGTITCASSARVAKELGAARGFRRPGPQLALVTVERDRVHLPGEARIRRDDPALVVELDDLAAYGEALVLGRFAVFVVKDRPGRHALTLAATLRSPRDDLRVARRQCTEWFPFGTSDRASVEHSRAN